MDFPTQDGFLYDIVYVGRYTNRIHSTKKKTILTSTAMLLAIAHFCFFGWLDGTKTDSRSIRQSHVTTISLVLVTAFKGCVKVAIGVAFSQHMWHVIRNKAFAIQHIEQLFTLRSNLVDILKVQKGLAAPMLFAMAVFVWILPLAPIYPPSALTVSSKSFTYIKNLNVSPLDVPQPTYDP
jgi:hypothetical protein